MKTIKKFTLDSLVPWLISDSERYKTEKWEISLVRPCRATNYTFEIYCIEWNLFEGVENYFSIESAEEKIYSLL